MSRRFILIVSAIALSAGLMFSPILRTQIPSDQPPEIAEQLKRRIWNNSPPVKSEYAGKKNAAPRPRRGFGLKFLF